MSEVLEPLIAAHRVAHPKAEIRLLQRAFDIADHWHSGQYRKSGDPYITHPLAVAGILANLGMDTTTLVAALLHDTIEDTPYTLDAMRTDFGPEVALLVDGVTKLDRVKLGDAAKAETIRKMVVAMAKDPRVLVIKLADRLHNMRTLTFLPRPKQEQKSKETLEILAPLAHRLGMNTIKWELEDLAFNTLFPKKFEEIHRLIDEHAPQRDGLLRQVTNRVQTDLKGAKVKAEVVGRPKHLYSIYQKMISRSREFAEIYDLVGVRILVESVRDCYAALGVIHANWQPVPGRFKDYIAMPKFNMYQSLHTTVIGPTGKPVEMQIRTKAMDRTAEYGIAAHWRYKETKGATVVGPPAHIDEMTWLRQLLDWQREAADPSEFLDALRFDLSSQEVYVFTPKGDVVALPSGSTPVDFAYAVHTEVGHRCIGARVNGKLVPLESTLSNGDVVEIFTSKSETAAPSQDWLGFVKSPRARTKIRQHFNKERRDEAIEAGKDAIVKAMRKQGLPLQRMLTSETLMTIARDLHLADGSALYAAVGESQVSAQSVVTRLVAVVRRRRGRGRGHRRDGGGHAATPQPWGSVRPGRRRGRRKRRLDQAGPLLHAGARRRGLRLRHPIGRCQRAPRGLRERAGSARTGGAPGRGDLEGDERVDVPGRDPGRGARPPQVTGRRDQGAVRGAGQHPVGDGHHDPGSGRGESLQLRDGRPEAPRAPARRRTTGGWRLRRLPGDVRRVTAARTTGRPRHVVGPLLFWTDGYGWTEPTVAVLMVTGSFGAPSFGSLLSVETTPALPTFCTMSRPVVTVPMIV